MRRWRVLIWSCIMAVALLSASAAAEWEGTFAIYDAQGSMLFSQEGELLVPRGAYVNLYCVSPEDCPREQRLFYAQPATPVEMPGTLREDEDLPGALMDAQGNLLTEAEYSAFTHYWQEGVVIFCQADRYGAMDTSGRVLLEAKYTSLVPNGEGGFLGTPESTLRYGEDGYPYWAELYRIDGDGREVSLGYTTSPYGLSTFSEGLCAVSIEVGEAQMYGYLNAQGEIAIEPQFQWANAFSNGLAEVTTLEGKQGLLRPDGSWALEPVYMQFASLYREGKSFAGETFLAWPDAHTIAVMDCKTLETYKTFRAPQAEYFSGYAVNESLYSISDGTRTAMCDARGKILFSFSNADGIYVDGYYGRTDGTPARMVRTQGDWPEGSAWLIAMDGSEVSGPYQSLSCVSWYGDQGRYMVASYETMTIQLEDGSTYQTPLGETYRYGLIDQDGKEILPVRYRALYECAPGLYWAREADFSGLLDEAGNWIYTISDYEQLMD